MPKTLKINNKNIRITQADIVQANFPFIYTLKTSKNLWFSDLFRGYLEM